ncbi:MAG: TRAP transporter small permease [Rhodobacteraceae bacterium]|nr:MAG: TRAP transporter small permease [Paracoccaceae bacterium]
MHAIAMGLSRALAMIGGIVLAALILMTCLSILGRQLSILLHSDLAQSIAPGLAAALLGMGVGPIFGDFELTELGMAFAIFCFLPLCQITAGHARVDIFTSFLKAGTQRWLRLVIEILFSAALILIAWRLSVGMMRRVNTGQTTFLLEIPYWWPYAACFVAASIAALVGIYMVWVRLMEAVSGQDIIGEGAEGEH